jgi:hypothetical protein
MDTIPVSYLPKGFDYYAGGHIHQRVEESLPDYEMVNYPGPILGYGRDFEQTAKGESRGFFIVEFDEKVKRTKFIELFGPDRIVFDEFDVTGINSNKANDEIQKKLSQLDVKDKIVVIKIKGELSGNKTSEVRTWDLKNLLLVNGALFVEVNKYGLSSKEFEAVKVTGEDVPTIEKKLLRENIGSVKVSDDALKAERGSRLAEKLLDTLRVDIKDNETKSDYSSRIIEQALYDLKIKKVFS